MTEPYSNTIDWEEFWDETDEYEALEANPSGEQIVDPLRTFLERRCELESYANVGCGPGATVFDVAERYPDADVVGYDAARDVLKRNREHARDRGVTNVSFERTILPEFDPDRQFDVVGSFFTLCYVADIETALSNLYDAVAPGGYLVFTYHNEYARSMFRNIAESPHEYLDDSSAWDPETFADRFELVLEGESLLSYRQIHDALGSWPQSVWSVTDVERYGAWRMNPLVFVPK